MSVVDEPNETRFAKLSPAGVAGFDGEIDGPEEMDAGVDLPEVPPKREVGNSMPELMGGFFVSFWLEDQLSPLKSSMVIVDPKGRKQNTWRFLGQE